LKLEVIPLINSDEQVTLTIAQQNDSLSGTRVIGGNTVPIINTQELLTEVTVKNRNTVILGGLIEDSAQDETSGLPILSDIPLLGTLFKNTTRSRPRRELVIMVQPEIVKRINDVTPASNRRIGETFVGPDTIEFSEQGGSQRTKLDSLWKLKGRPEGPKTPRAEIVTPLPPVQPTTIQFIPAEPELAPEVVPETTQVLSTPAGDNEALLIQPDGIERPQSPQ